MSSTRVCTTCPLDDNEWPESMFYADHTRCKACYRDQKALAKKLKELADTPEERLRLRKRMGICQECPNPVRGVVGKTLHCEACGRRHDLARRRKTDTARRRGERGDKRRARKRELHAERMANDPVYAAAYRKRKQHETSINHPSYSKRIEYFTRTNAEPERAQKKRDWAKNKYYELHPERPQPVCATCQEPIPYDGKGKPPKYHQTDECIPYARGRRRAA